MSQQISTTIRLNGIEKVEKIHTAKTGDRKTINAKIDGVELEMELDTGAPCGIISSNTLRKLKQNFHLQPTDRQFASYTHHRLNCIGRLPVNVTVGNLTRRLNLYVVEGDYDSLFGREWLAQFISEVKLTEMFAPMDIHNPHCRIT